MAEKQFENEIDMQTGLSWLIAFALSTDPGLQT